MRNSLSFLSLLAFPGIALADGGGIPMYLLSDIRYLIFLALYILLTILAVLFAVAKANARDAKEPLSLSKISLVASFLMTLGLGYQMVHHLEHVSQIFQYWYLGLKSSSSRGLLFFLDLEWNHFIFDSGYFLLMTAAAFLFGVYLWQRGGKMGRFGAMLLLSGVLVQGWHAVEHTVRLVRHIDQGCDPCRGVVDTLTGVQLIPLHFWYNVVALTLPLMAYFYFRMDKRMLAEAKSWYAQLRSKPLTAAQA